MTIRVVLTVLWGVFFLAALLGSFAYSEIPGDDGFLAVLPEQRKGLLVPILQLYAIYLGGIIACWFGRPFTRLGVPQLGAEKVRAWIAVIVIIVFNVGYLWLVTRAHFFTDADPFADAADATVWAKYAAWIVAPVNAYYFGTSSSKGGSKAA
jgi:hypothetical protein